MVIKMSNQIIEAIVKAYQQLFDDDQLAAEVATYTDVVSPEEFLRELVESVINDDVKLCVANMFIEEVDSYTVVILDGRSKDFVMVYDNNSKRVVGTAIVRWAEYK